MQAPDLDQPIVHESERDYRSLLASSERTLDDVDRALAALDAGTYGRCELCGDGIPDADLARDPLATTCALHTSGHADVVAD